MQVYKILKLLDLTGKTIPCDMQDQLSQTYFSESKQVPIAIGDMDIVHLIRAFNKRNPMSSKFLENFVDQFIDKSTKRLNNMEKKQNGY